jgi:hypothetical protein
VVGTVTTRMEGRERRVFYRQGPDQVLEVYFEFGGSDVVAIVSFGSAQDWAATHSWAAARWGEILRVIPTELCRRDASSVDPESDEATGVILLRRRAGAAPLRPLCGRRRRVSFGGSTG